MWFSKEIIKEMYKENLLLVSNCKKNESQPPLYQGDCDE